MNANLPDTHASIHYYDSDYPTPDGPYPENFDEVTAFQGLTHDLGRYRELAAEAGGPILEVCCGTGRVAIALARAGHTVAGVDLSTGMLQALDANLARETPVVRARVSRFEADATTLALGDRRFPLAILAFNSLLCIPDFAAQRAALAAVARHLGPGGRLVLDVVNPLQLKLKGDPIPQPFFTRRATQSGRTYTRFAMCEPLDSEQRQRLHGWYDELDSDGTVRRRMYSMVWRPIFRFELELMLAEAALRIRSLEGGHQREPFTAASPRMFVVAERRA